MTRQRVDFTITIRGSWVADMNDDDCPLHEFSSLSFQDLLLYMGWASDHHLMRDYTIEEMKATCLDPPLVQLARQADDESR